MPDYFLTPQERFIREQMEKQTALLQQIQQSTFLISEAVRTDANGVSFLITEAKVY